METTFERAMAAAAAAGPGALLELWRASQRAGATPPEAAVAVARALIAMARPDAALTVLEGAGDGVRARQLRALAMAKADRIDQAIAALAALRDEGILDVETGGMLAGCYKKRGLSHDNPADVQAAYQVYLETYEASGDSYPGINAASLALALGDAGEAARIAAEVLALVSLPPDRMDAWMLATRGEALLLLGDLPGARTWYRRAVGDNPNAAGSIAAMRRQARANLRALGLDEHALDDVLIVRTVVAFTGHVIDEPGRPTARFPSSAEGAVRRTIRERLKHLRAGFGFSSAARGADVLFLEEMLERGASAQVFLPFPYDQFVQTSVGPGWRSRVDRILADPRVTLVTLQGAAPDTGLETAFRACADAVAQAAIRLARGLEDEPTLVAVWDGGAGDGGGGTFDAVRAWEGTGYRLEVISPVDIQPVVTPAPARSSATRDIVSAAAGRRRAATRFQYANRHCLCIGIREYQHSPWMPLANARRDAEEVGKALADLHGFTEPLFLLDGQATASAMAACIGDQLQRRAGPDDLVVVFFAGHGHTKRMGGQEHGFIVPVDARGDETTTLVSVDQFSLWSTYLECRHVLYVFDSCFSGMFQRMAGGDRMEPDVSRARLAITSGQANQPVYDGGGETGHSVFAGGLLRALREGVEGRREYTATELYAYLRRVVTERFPEQTPTLATLKNHEGGEILFHTIA